MRYCPDWSSAYSAVLGLALAHLEIDGGGTALPCSETGYLSVFEPAAHIADEGGPVDYVLAWLEQAARCPEWLALQEQTRQLALF